MLERGDVVVIRYHRGHRKQMKEFQQDTVFEMTSMVWHILGPQYDTYYILNK